MKLGDLITTLEAFPADAPLRFADGSIPNGLRSWRGSYDELTIDRGVTGDTDTVGKLLKNAKQSVNRTFQGYKGGDYLMSAETPVWADKWGEYGCIAPAGLAFDGAVVVIYTSDLSDYR